MASATKTLGFEEIETPEQYAKTEAYAQRLAHGVEEDIAESGLHGLRASKENARELHRLIVAMVRYWD